MRRRHARGDHVLHLEVMGPGDVAVRSKGDLHSRSVQFCQIPRLDAERLLSFWLIGCPGLQFLQLGGWKRFTEPAEVHRDSPTRKVGHEDQIRLLLEQGEHLVVDVPDPERRERTRRSPRAGAPSHPRG